MRSSPIKRHQGIRSLRLLGQDVTLSHNRDGSYYVVDSDAGSIRRVTIRPDGARWYLHGEDDAACLHMIDAATPGTFLTLREATGWVVGSLADLARPHAR